MITGLLSLGKLALDNQDLQEALNIYSAPSNRAGVRKPWRFWALFQLLFGKVAWEHVQFKGATVRQRPAHHE